MSLRKRTGLAVALAAVTAASLATAGSAAPAAPPPPAAGFTKPWRGMCDIASLGPQAVAAELALTLPTSVYVGDPVRPKDVKVKLVFPVALVDALKAAEIGTVEGMAGMRLGASAAGSRTELPARGPFEPTALPETGELAVDVPATVAADVPARKAGKIAFTTGPLELLLLSRKADGSSIGEPKPVVCVPDDGQDTAIGDVTVFQPAVKVPRTTTPTEPGRSPAVAVPREPGRTLPTRQPNPGQQPGRAGGRQEEPDPCAGEIPPDSYNFWSYYPLSGRAEVRKLNSGIDFGPGYLSAQLFFWWTGESGEIACGAVLGDLMWPTAPGAFTAFRFVPSSSDVTVVPVGRAEGRLNNGVFTGQAKADLVLGNVKVNGTALAVGDRCRTGTPVLIDLLSTPEQWDVFVGGSMETEVVIPPYAGCGARDPLDPLITGLVSGPANKLTLSFGNIVICEPPDQPCVPPLAGPGRR